MRFNNTIFSELLTLVSRSQFEQCVNRYDGDKHSKGFSCWNQFVVMLYGQLTGKRSLREIEAGFNKHSTNHYHLHTGFIKRSTLADANNKRNAGIFYEVLQRLMQSGSRQLRSKTSQAMQILDSTQIHLNKALYDWAAKGHRVYGIKAHIAYSLDAEIPVYFDMSNANINDVALFNHLTFEPGVLYLFDKGYCDYLAWQQIINQGAHFITRAKNNMGYEVIEQHAPDTESIISDQIVKLKNTRTTQAAKSSMQSYCFRLITAYDHQGRMIKIITSHLKLAATQVLESYRQRWQIEIFFKWIKQNLKVKRFIGRSENAVRLQLIIAIIAYVLLRLWHQMTQSKDNLQYLAVIVKECLMNRIAKQIKPPSYKSRFKYNSLQLDLLI